MSSVDVDFKKIKKFMKEKKVSEYGLSKVMGVSYSYIYRVMRLQRTPGQAFTNGLIKAGMQPNDIFLTSSLSKDNTCNSCLKAT